MLISFATEAYPQSDAAEWARPSSVQRLARAVTRARAAARAAWSARTQRLMNSPQPLHALARKRVLFPWHLAILLFCCGSLHTFNIARPERIANFLPGDASKETRGQ